jgi:hypothetical protein
MWTFNFALERGFFTTHFILQCAPQVKVDQMGLDLTQEEFTVTNYNSVVRNTVQITYKVFDVWAVCRKRDRLSHIWRGVSKLCRTLCNIRYEYAE